ncbi:MAG: TonB-dependent receptor [Crocinitomicaceae bacterium]|nr:TonB-dependent receptor [Crocinitomicaceae bacterium]
MKFQLLLAFVLVFCVSIVGAQITQNVRGTVVDVESKYPLIGVKVQIYTSDSTLFRGLTDEYGDFELRNVPVGKYEITFDYNFYNSSKQTVIVQSGKESIVNSELEEEIITTEEVEIIGNANKDVQNEMALVSAQQFSIEETERYPGSRADPARMASNFAGVQGADDTRNDIVIRGNSPLGLIYKVEGVDIPNPNHFAISGSAGGPVAIINNKILGNSDFFMSAFPAEYGNSISGVFDLRFRNGNQTKHELTGQFGFLGTEIMAEGPINKEKRSSYLFMGRYSTLSMFQAIGISIGTDAVPVYGDGAFKFSFPQKNGGNLSFFGMGGASSIDIVVSEQTEVVEEAFGEGDRDQYFKTSMGIFGATYKKPLNENTFIKTTIATTFDTQNANHNFLIRSLDTALVNGEQSVSIRTDSIYPLMGYQFKTNRLSWYGAINHKISKQHIIKAGFNVDGYLMKNIDSALNAAHDQFRIRHDFEGMSFLIQPFVQYKWKVNQHMDLTAGIHSQYFSLSNSISYAEPRLGWQYRLKNKQVLSAGAGLHSQTQPLYQYTYQRYDAQSNPVLHNKNMDFTRSFHSAVGYEKTFEKSLRFKSEVYYQQLYNIPVDMKPSAFSLINQGSGFQRFFPDTLVNNGTARNYGIELTVQKFFDQSFFYMITASFFESKYNGSDGVERDTDFNGNYAANFLAGREFKIKDKNVLSLGLKFTVAGGRRYGDVDVPATLEENELIFQDEGFNSRQFDDYYRLDFRTTYKINTKKLTHEIGLDLVNILNTRNILALSYAPSLSDPTAEPIAERYQLGFLPIFYYRVDFRLEKQNKN